MGEKAVLTIIITRRTLKNLRKKIISGGGLGILNVGINLLCTEEIALGYTGIRKRILRRL
jgi:hypothetical protein